MANEQEGPSGWSRVYYVGGGGGGGQRRKMRSGPYTILLLIFVLTYI